MGYAANGNILSKAAVDGTALSDYKYESPRPHAVTGVTAGTSTYSYAYDANGNLTTRERRVGGVVKETWSTKWAGFDKPRWLINATTGKGDEFTYNANRSRVVHLSIDGVNGSGATATPSRYSRKKVYGLGPQLEADYSNASGVGVPPAWSLQKLRIYVPGPEGLIGTMEFEPTNRSSKPETALVYHYDHLGSIERITPHGSTSTTTVLDGQGKPSRYSYDAWGQRRNADTWSGAPTTTTDGGSDDATPRGYTGHEMLDDLGLVHMNGRIYDPLLGRFLSADIVVQNQGDLQAYNRYSYVLNRPLTMTDPTGFFYNISPLPLRVGLQASGASEATVDKATATWQMGDAARSKGTLMGSSMVVTTVATGGASIVVGEAALAGNTGAQLLVAGTAAAGLADGATKIAEGAGELSVNPKSGSGWCNVIGGALESGLSFFGFRGFRQALAETPVAPSTAASTTTTTAADSAGTPTPATTPARVNPVAAEPVTTVPAETTGARLALPAPKTPTPRLPGPTTDPVTGQPVGRFVGGTSGPPLIEPVGGRTVPAGRGGVDTHTLYPNGSNYQRLNPVGHANNPTPHAHGHAPGTGPGMRGQGPSLDTSGKVVPWNSAAAHWPYP